MASYLVMDAVAAAGLRGATAGDDQRLDPRALADGRFALPVAVLGDPGLAWLGDALGALETVEIGEADWLPVGD
jgi:hypothetical protein